MGADRVLSGDCNQQGVGLLLDSGAFTDAGSRYRDLNQDYAVLQPVFSQQELRDGEGAAQQSLIAAVLDGHGMLGEFAAERAGNAAVAAACSALLAHATPAAEDSDDLEASHAEGILHEAFEAGHAAALDLYKDPPRKYCYPTSLRDEKYRLMWVGGLPMYTGSVPQPRLIEFGATCTLALLHGSLLTIGNAGDSAAILGRRQRDGTFTGEELTVRHWGLNPDERTRVQAQRNAAVDVMNSDGYLSVASGRWKGYQLSMTRALGHSMLSDFGVIWAPSVRLHRLAPGDCCLVLASDGVWDVFGANEAVRLVMEIIDGGGSAADAAQALVRQAVRRAMEGPDGDADNTTAVVLAFVAPPLQSAATGSSLSGPLVSGADGVGVSSSEAGSTHGGSSSAYESSVYEGSAHSGSAFIPELHPIGAMRIGMQAGRAAKLGAVAPEGVVYGGSAHGGNAFGPGGRHVVLHHAQLSSSI